MMQTGSFHASVALLAAGLRCPCYSGLGKDPDPSEHLMDLGESPISAQNVRWWCVECAPAGAAGDSVFGKFLRVSASPWVKEEGTLEPHPLGCPGTRIRESSSSLGLASASTL